jgi:L-amino acid N-acyltransferase YncA
MIIKHKNTDMMYTDITIRPATADDAEALVDIYAPYVEHTAITYEYAVPSVSEFRSRIINTLKTYPYIVAEKERLIVGYAYAGQFKERAAYSWCVETTIYVKSDFKRGGIGSLLYTKLEDILRLQNILNLNACIACPAKEDEYLNKDSIRFHERMGFTRVGEFHNCGYKFNRWYNMVWMEKSIGEHVANQKKIIPFSDLQLV